MVTQALFSYVFVFFFGFVFGFFFGFVIFFFTCLGFFLIFDLLILFAFRPKL